MWYRESNRIDWSDAIAHLRKDPGLVPILDRVGACTLKPRKDYFVLLCLAIFNQQIAMKTAETLFRRFASHFPSGRPTPQRVIPFIETASEETLRHCGLSRQKRGYLLDLAKHFASNSIPTRRIASMTDDEVIAALTAVKGIGRWTAEMFLMFTLNRPDVFPVDDLGLQKGMQRILKSRVLPSERRMIKRAEIWRPYRTIATWYIWRGTEPVQPITAAKARS
jgi:DNA-3-methyladenine glycosylase II